MIFSYSEMDKALRIVGHFYNKIIFVDFIEDKYRLIKINDIEYKHMQHSDVNFFDWINGFKNSEYSMNLNYNFDPDILKSIDRPLILNYKKSINGVMKDVTLEMVPVGTGRAYIFVKDYSADIVAPCVEGGCDKCSEECC